jgi:hypothetical protein
MSRSAITILLVTDAKDALSHAASTILHAKFRMPRILIEKVLKLLDETLSNLFECEVVLVDLNRIRKLL